MIRSLGLEEQKEERIIGPSLVGSEELHGKVCKGWGPGGKQVGASR